MGEKDQICDHCQDVIFSVKDNAARIQRGYFNIYGEFLYMGVSEIRHERCHNLIEARAIVMADIAAKVLFGDKKEEK